VKKTTHILLPFRPFLLLLGLLVGTLALRAEKQLPEPSQFLVNDYAGLLSRNEVVALGDKLRAYVGETSTQIVIVTEKSLEGDDPFTYVQRLATSWGIGGKENSNGILIYVAEQDRQIRIQTGFGTEGFLPDILAKQIIDNILKPAFRTGNYYQGLDRATDAIMDMGRGEYEGDGLPTGQKQSIPGWIIIVFIILMVLIVSWVMRNDDDDDDDGGYYRDGRYDMPDRRYRRGRTIIFPGTGGFWGSGGGGGGGGGFGGFGGGGFGGFGGGGFGGGGAGGSW